MFIKLETLIYILDRLFKENIGDLVLFTIKKMGIHFKQDTMRWDKLMVMGLKLIKIKINYKLDITVRVKNKDFFMKKLIILR